MARRFATTRRRGTGDTQRVGLGTKALPAEGTAPHSCMAAWGPARCPDVRGQCSSLGNREQVQQVRTPAQMQTYIYHERGKETGERKPARCRFATSAAKGCLISVLCGSGRGMLGAGGDGIRVAQLPAAALRKAAKRGGGQEGLSGLWGLVPAAKSLPVHRGSPTQQPESRRGWDSNPRMQSTMD